MAKGAHEYGLIPLEAVADIDRVEGETGCQCMAAAREILDRHFKAKNNRGDVPRVDIDEVYSSFDRDVKAYQKRSNRQHCQTKQLSACTTLAPALFDLVLQQVRRYP